MSVDISCSSYTDASIKEVLDTVRSIEGLSRHPGVHAAGIVITPGPVEDYAPVQVAKDGSLVTQYTMNDVSAVGILKVDFLGLRTLTVVEQCLRMIKQNHGVPHDFDIYAIQERDKKTFSLLQSGQCAGVFQLESSGMQSLVIDIRPESIDDIIPLVALYRPGPMEQGITESFVRRRHGDEAIAYLHDSLRPILSNTYGLIVYQDQILKIRSDVAGMTPLGADNVLRAMGKKKQDKMDAQKPEFISGAIEKSGFDEEQAETLWNMMAEFAKYCFNRNHAAAYAMLSYQTAWLKAHYPIEFMAALMTSVADNKDKVVIYIDECRRMGLSIHPPDVNRSVANFTVDGNGIRFGLMAINGIGEKPIQAIIDARSEGPFVDMFDFCMRVNVRQCQKSSIDTMVKAGAFDSIEPDRATAVAWLDTCFASAQAQRKDRISG